jgi:hypothetical protein
MIARPDRLRKHPAVFRSLTAVAAGVFDGLFQALTQVNRHGRKKHEHRVRAVAGLVNRRIDARLTT